MADGSLALTKLSNATRMLAEVRDAKDAKNVMDLAASAEHYARKAKLGEEAILYAHAIKIDAQAMMGHYLKEAPSPAGRPPLITTQREVINKPKTLDDLKVTFKESTTSQLLDTIKAEQPEEFQRIKSGEKTFTQVKRERVKAEALKRVIEMPSGKFRVVYSDPPWKYGDGREALEGTTGASAHYPSMSITELCSMTLPELEDNAVLFLWVTSPLIFECHPVIKAWGFFYKAMFVWDKVMHNMGHYNSVRHELLLMCTRGSCLPDSPKLLDSVQSFERTKEHSRKPEEFRSIIDAMYPHGKRVELFARGPVPGPWEKWGAE